MPVVLGPPKIPPPLVPDDAPPKLKPLEIPDWFDPKPKEEVVVVVGVKPNIYKKE